MAKLGHGRLGPDASDLMDTDVLCRLGESLMEVSVCPPSFVVVRTTNCLRCARLHSLADGNNCVCLQKQSQWKRIHRKKVSEEVRPDNSPLIAL